MAKPRTIILRAAGTNCDVETAYAFSRAGSLVELLHVNRFLERPTRLREYEILAIPGGFTYGDDIAAGVVLANQLAIHLKEEVSRFVEEDKLIIGICNGFQALVKAGFLPWGKWDRHDGATLTYNDSGRFEDRWICLKVASSKSVFLKGVESLSLPVAHGEGKFVVKDRESLRRLRQSKQIVLRYVDPEGRPAGYPWNPNGSDDNIAGVCDPTGRVLGLMPHPERFVEPFTHPRWTRTRLKREGDGAALFKNAVEYFTGA